MQEHSDTLRVTMIQTTLVWEDPAANLSLFDTHLSTINSGSTDLILLPELFSTGFTMNPKPFAEAMDGKTLAWMSTRAKEKQCVITGSLIIVELGKYYNRLIWMRPDGTFEKYDKHHLFRYAGEQNHYAAGTEKLMVQYKGWNICPLICYDLRFPVWSRNKPDKVNAPSTDLILYIANWPERRSHPWKTLLLARAIENQCYVAGLNRIGFDGNNVQHTGDSAIIDPKGEIVSDIPSGKSHVETVTLRKQELNEWRASFPAWMDADDFTFLS